MNNTKPFILITNDDGINALGLSVLAQEIQKIAEVVIVAPDTERSAVGHAITLTEPLRAKKVYRNEKFYGYAVNGTPADSVKLAIKSLLNKTPDLVISGINLGPNTGTNVIYSGTVSAATEAAILDLKAIAVSLGTFINPEYGPAARYIRLLAQQVITRSLPHGVLLNVNVPPIPESEIRGIKVTHQGMARFQEIMEERIDLRGSTYYWLGGEMASSDPDPNSDHTALSNNYITVTPLHYDMTNYSFISELKGWGIWSG